MLQKPLVVALAALVFLSISPVVPAQHSCDKQFVVSQVSLPTATQLSVTYQAAVRARLIGHCFDNQELGELAAIAGDTLHSLGYLRSTVSEPFITIVDASRHPQPVSLDVTVEEGTRYRVTEVQWWNLEAISFEQARSVSQIQLGEFLDMGKIRETAEAAHRLYSASGYPNASIVPEIQFSEGPNVTVAFKVIEGRFLP